MEVPFNNKKILAKFDGILNNFHRLCSENDIDFKDYNQKFISHLNINVPGISSKDIESLVSEEYFRRVHLPNWEKHIGFPEIGRVVEIEDVSKRSGEEFFKFHQHAKNELPVEIGTASSALLVYYPKDGLTGWHTNWNANAYQILFTWSETGDGFFRYYDKAKDEVVTIQDKPGWQCRWYYFGRKDEIEDHCWHACYTRCERMTLAFKFSNEGKDSEKDSLAQILRDELVAEISSDE